MNFDIYKQDSVDKIALMVFDDRIYSNSNIREDVTLTETVNAGTDFVIGSTCAAQLDFSLLNINEFTVETDLIDKEFTYKLGANTDSTTVYRAYQQARQDLLIKNGAYWYGGNRKGNFLTIWKEESGTLTQQPVPQQPEQDVLSMFIWNGKLYCGHAMEPYVSAYQINANGSLTKVSVTLNSLQTAQILDLNRRKRVFKYTDNLLYAYEKEWSSGRVTDYIEFVYEFTQIGIFIPKEAKKKDERILIVTAYDRMIYFDTTADYVLNNQQYPVTVLAFLQRLCAFVGVPLETTSFLNADYLIQKNARTQNVTGRQMLQWVAEAAARFARVTRDGKLSLQWYADINYTIDASHGGVTDYTNVTVADYTTKKVDKLQIKATQNDIGVIVPADDPNKTNLYVIENNPIFYAETDAELRPTAEKIFNAIKDFQYVPYVLSCKGNPLVRAGSAFSLTTAKGEHLHALIMSKKMKGVKALTDQLSATGNAQRSVQSNAINQAIQQLRGSTHEIIVDITQLNSTITEYQLKTDSSITKINENLDNFSESVTGSLDSLQAQVDGQIESWFYDYVPTLTNKPASDWQTNADKDKHLGDLFYNSQTGIGYRFSKTGSTYSWQILKDTDIGKALADAQKAQDTADGKRRVFVVQPVPPYDVGDLWTNASYGTQYKNDLLRCRTAKKNGPFDISDWEKASKYTDDSSITNFINGVYAEDKNSLVNQIDQKAETWYQADDPSNGWNMDEKKNHVGDLWYNTATQETYYYGKDFIWEKQDVPKEIFDQINGKSTIYASQPVPPYDIGDLWVNATYGTQYSNDLLRCRTSRAEGSFSIADWEKASKYTDDSKANEVSEQLVIAQSQIDQNSKQIALKVSQTIYDEKMQVVDQRLTSLDLTIEGMKLAVDNHKLTFDANGLTIYNGGFSIYNGNEKIFGVASDGSGVDMVGSFVNRGKYGTIQMINGVITITDYNTVGSGATISMVGNNLNIDAGTLESGASVHIAPYVSDLNVGVMRLFARSGQKGYWLSKGTVHMSGDTFHPVLWK